MALIKKAGKSYVFSSASRKYSGVSLDEVAKKDQSYLVWAWRKLTEEVSPELSNAVAEVMEKHGIVP
jgi:hypothetical protein